MFVSGLLDCMLTVWPVGLGCVMTVCVCIWPVGLNVDCLAGWIGLCDDCLCLYLAC